MLTLQEKQKWCNNSEWCVKLNDSAKRMEKRMRQGVTQLLGLLSIGLCMIVIGAPSQSRQAGSPQKRPEKSPEPLEREIHHQLSVLPYSSVFDYVSFTLDGNNVTLTGHVLRPTLKADAVAAIKSIEGVGTVVNRIEVLPVSPVDDELRRQIYRAIYEDAVLQQYATEPMPAIHIIVTNGNVILEGIVEIGSDRNLAATRACGVSGVVNLKNNLRVRTREDAAK
jgi:hyperosmotically inducible protein